MDIIEKGAQKSLCFDLQNGHNGPLSQDVSPLKRFLQNSKRIKKLQNGR